MLSGRWNIWTTGILVALLAGAAVAAFAIWTTASVPHHRGAVHTRQPAFSRGSG